MSPTLNLEQPSSFDERRAWTHPTRSAAHLPTPLKRLQGSAGPGLRARLKALHNAA